MKKYLFRAILLLFGISCLFSLTYRAAEQQGKKDLPEALKRTAGLKISVHPAREDRYTHQGTILNSDSPGLHNKQFNFFIP
jgi:hypothetical protein